MQQNLEYSFLDLQGCGTSIGNKRSFVETPSMRSETFQFIAYPGFLIFRSPVPVSTVVHQDSPLSRQCLPKPCAPLERPRRAGLGAALGSVLRWAGCCTGLGAAHAAGRSRASSNTSHLIFLWCCFFSELDFTDIILSILPQDP